MESTCRSAVESPPPLAATKIRSPRWSRHSSRSARSASLISVGGCVRVTALQRSRQLEALAEDEHAASDEGDVPVGFVRVALRAGAFPRLEVSTMLARVPELEFPSLTAKTIVDQRLHVGSFKETAGQGCRAG